jgi:hypothetical protein
VIFRACDFPRQTSIRIFLCVSFAFCCNLWDLNFIFPLLLFAAICSILGYSKKFPKTTDFQK